MLGVGLALTGVRGVGPGSQANRMLSRESQGLALDFTDDFFLASTGHYGSARVKDTSTPANNYNSHPFGLLTYAGASPKLCRGPDGNLRYGAHNLCPYSEEFDNWNVVGGTVLADQELAPNGSLTADKLVNDTTVTQHQVLQNFTPVAGFSYTFSVRLKAGEITFANLLFGSAAFGFNVWAYFDLENGTLGSKGSDTTSSIESLGNGWYLCTITATATTSTTSTVSIQLSSSDFGSRNATYRGDGSSGFYIWGAHVRRTPSDDTYLKTTDSARYELPYEWDENGDLLGIRVEEQRTNLALWSNDFTKAVWVKTNITAAKTAMGPDGIANSASTLTATAANATALQSITSTSAQRITSCYIKRRTGSGNIELTQDNGSTWTPVTVTSEWTRVNLPAVTSANPTVGIRIVTSGDAVDVAYFQHEVGSFVTSPIETAGSTVTRAWDYITLATSKFPIGVEYTMVFGMVPTVDNFGTYDYFAGVDNGGVNDRASFPGQVWFSPRVRVGGVDSANDFMASAPFTAGQLIKCALRVKEDDFAACYNGTGFATDDSGPIPDVTRLVFFGKGHWVDHFILIPRALSETEMLEITSL